MAKFASDPAHVESKPNDARAEAEPKRQLALFHPERDRVEHIGQSQRAKPARGRDRAGATGSNGPLPIARPDRALLRTLEEALAGAREAGDDRPALVVLASRLGDVATPCAPPQAVRVSVRRARDEWLRRLEVQQKSASTLVGYRVAIDDLLDWSETDDRDPLEEAAIVDYLRSYRQRASPAQSTYYRRFVLLRRFLRWAVRRHGLPDPFRDLDAPPKPRQESDWLAPAEFRRLLDAAGRPERNLPGLAERDQLVLLTLVLTGLRRSELCALDWRDLELDGRKPSLLVRSGKGGKSRRQPIPASLARQLQRLANAHNPEATDPVFCGLQGGRLQQTILADIVARAARRAELQKQVTAHTLRHTAATWLRQERGDTRLVAEYLGHADLSTVARYAHVDREELFEAARQLERLAAPGDECQSEVDDASARPDRPSRRRRGRRRHGRHRAT